MSTNKKILLSLCVIGIGVSAYLAYAKLTSNPLVCGSNFGCNVVQNSDYSNLLGIPLGIWGMGFYFVLFTLIYVQKNKTVWLTEAAIFWGILFSTYLTYLEAFVIKAYCMWCLISFANIIVIGILYFFTKKGKDSVEEK